MKKKICAIFLILIFITLSSCKSEEVKTAERLIDAIGEVTLESEDAIIAAEEAVELLTEDNRKNVDNISRLDSARNEYEQLVLQNQVAKIEEVISAIGTITLDSANAIEQAQEAYDNASLEVQKLVKNYSQIQNSRDALHRLEIEKEVKDVEEYIEVIGEVELSSKSIESIRNAEQAYQKASEEAKAFINYHAIEIAREQYHQLEIEDKSQKIEKIISEIGTITLDSETKIQTAQKAYSAADSDVKELVSNYELLESAINTFRELKASTVITLIDSIGNVTIDSESLIAEAREAYNKLDRETKALVENEEILTSAEEELRDLINQKSIALLNTLIPTEDKVNKLEWLEHPRMPKYYNVRSFFFPYIGRLTDTGYTWLRVKANYYGDDWVFFNEIIISADGENTSVKFGSFETEHKIAYGGVAEIGDFMPDESQIEALKSIENSKETIIRFVGDSSYYDLVLSAADKQAIIEVLAAYEYLRNNPTALG